MGIDVVSSNLRIANNPLKFTGDVAGPGYWTSDLNTESEMNLNSGNAENYLYNFAVNLYWMRFLEASHQLTDEWEQWSLNALNKCNYIAY